MFHQAVLFAVADEAVVAALQFFFLGQFFRGQFRITAGNDDPGVRIVAQSPAQGLARLSPGAAGDGAGVDDDDVGICAPGDHLHPGFFKPGPEGRRFILVDLATQCRYRYTDQRFFPPPVVPKR